MDDPPFGDQTLGKFVPAFILTIAVFNFPIFLGLSLVWNSKQFSVFLGMSRVGCWKIPLKCNFIRIGVLFEVPWFRNDHAGDFSLYWRFWFLVINFSILSILLLISKIKSASKLQNLMQAQFLHAASHNSNRQCFSSWSLTGNASIISAQAETRDKLR